MCKKNAAILALTIAASATLMGCHDHDAASQPQGVATALDTFLDKPNPSAWLQSSIDVGNRHDGAAVVVVEPVAIRPQKNGTCVEWVGSRGTAADNADVQGEYCRDSGYVSPRLSTAAYD